MIKVRVYHICIILEFMRVGYYVHNYYDTPELEENRPETPLLDRIRRYVDIFNRRYCRKLINEPRVTRFKIDWGVQDVVPLDMAVVEPQGQLQGQAMPVTAPSSAPLYELSDNSQIADWIKEMQQESMMMEEGMI